MEEVWYKLQTSIRGDIGRNAMFREHMENEQTCYHPPLPLTTTIVNSKIPNKSNKNPILPSGL